MSFLKNIEQYGDAHHPKWLDILRILLGILLIVKGFIFIWNIVPLEQLLLERKLPVVLKYYVEFAHLFGGILILVGFKTRIAVLFQIPILIGAVFFNFGNGIYATNSELEYSILILFLLIFFLIYGSGPLSADNILNKTNRENEIAEARNLSNKPNENIQ